MNYRKFPLHTPKNYLKAILESIELYNSHAQADMANWLYEGYKEASKDPNKAISKKTIILELLSKWIQVWEALALLGLMFGGKVIGETREPYEIYVSYHTQQVMRFLDKAKKGLPNDAIMGIYGFKSAQQLLKEGVINPQELANFKIEIADALRSGKITFQNAAREFVGKKRRGKSIIDPSFLVNIYYQTRHGFKVIQATETSKKIWDIQDEDIAITERVSVPRWNKNRKIIRAGIFKKFDDIEVEKLVKQINDWCNAVKDITLTQIDKLENPNWFVAGIRAHKTKRLLLEGKRKPGRNAICLCGSELKFKKCCEPTI